MGERILIKGARVLSPADGLDCALDVLADGGRIAAMALPGTLEQCDAGHIDAPGYILAPGLVDMHVHLRDPGYTNKEDIRSGCAAARAGGFTYIVSMPNTAPPVDSPELVRYVIDNAEGCSVRPSACITVGMKGERLTDFAALKEAGAVAVTDDGRPVESRELMRRALVEAAAAGLAVISHCEDLAMVAGGKMNLGRVSTQLGVPGMDRRSEDSITRREIELAGETGCPVHIAHVSTRGAVEAIREAKARGVRVTAETAPHYLTFTEDALLSRDANFRMNPPLREQEDVDAVTAAVCDGTIDAIATDHAPHSPEEKSDFLAAPNGVIGMESSFAASYTALVASGRMTLGRLIELMSVNPAKILGIDAGRLRIGAPAAFALLDTLTERVFSAEELKGKSVNCPFIGRKLTGRARALIL